jgi:hypothetical protein
MTAFDWGAWVAYEIVVAGAVLVLWMRQASPIARPGILARLLARSVGAYEHPAVARARGVRARLQSWGSLLLIAFVVALSLGASLKSGALPALLAYGMASNIICSAAMVAATETGPSAGPAVEQDAVRARWNEAKG